MPRGLYRLHTVALRHLLLAVRVFRLPSDLDCSEISRTSAAVLRLTCALWAEEASRMKPLPTVLLSAILILAIGALGQGTKTADTATAPTLSSVIDREISAVEKEI